MNLSKRFLRQPLALLITLAAIVIVTLLGPIEKTLGANLRLVLLHGAWVWNGKVAFGIAALAGAGVLICNKRLFWLAFSRASAYTGMFFWLTYLPMSLAVMQLNWGGLFFDEPRWRIPFLFGVIAVLLQVGLWIFSNRWITAAGNLIFGVALWVSLGGVQNILHPDAPVAQSDSTQIQGYFLLLLALSFVFAVQLTLWIFEKMNQPRQTA